MNTNKDLLPPIELYREYLFKSVKKFNITIDQARSNYGKFTINQFENLLNNN